MNIEYVADKDKAIVSNENGELKIKDYTLNFDETRKKENEVEFIKNRFCLVNNEISQYQTEMIEERKKTKKGLLAVVGTVVGINVFFYHFTNIFVMENAIIASLFAGCGVSVYPLLTFSEYKILKDKLNAMNFQKYFLDKKLYQSQKELQALYLNDKMTMIEKRKQVKIEDSERIKKLEEYFRKLQQYGNRILEHTKRNDQGLWGVKEEEQIIRDGLELEWFTSYLNEHNIRKRTQRKKIL